MLAFSIDKDDVYCPSETIIDDVFWKTVVKVMCCVPIRFLSIHHCTSATSSGFGAKQDTLADLLARTIGSSPVQNHYGMLYFVVQMTPCH